MMSCLCLNVDDMAVSLCWCYVCVSVLKLRLCLSVNIMTVSLRFTECWYYVCLSAAVMHMQWQSTWLSDQLMLCRSLSVDVMSVSQCWCFVCVLVPMLSLSRCWCYVCVSLFMLCLGLSVDIMSVSQCSCYVWVSVFMLCLSRWWSCTQQHSKTKHWAESPDMLILCPCLSVDVMSVS